MSTKWMVYCASVIIQLFSVRNLVRTVSRRFVVNWMLTRPEIRDPVGQRELWPQVRCGQQQPVPIISFLVDSYRLLMQASITIRRQQQAHASIEGVCAALCCDQKGNFFKNLTSNAFFCLVIFLVLCVSMFQLQITGLFLNEFYLLIYR